MTSDDLKQKAAFYAVDTYAKSDMIIGLGSGSTSVFALSRLAEHLASGQLTNILGIPCSLSTDVEARRLKIPLTTLEAHPIVDVTFDGADEVGPLLNVIKGGGGALLREKIVAQATHQEIIMVDESKLSPMLGTNWAVPIEVTQFGLGAHLKFLQDIGGTPKLRLKSDGEAFTTDQGNYILDTHFGPIEDPGELADMLKTHAGIVEHGLFLGLTAAVVVASPDNIRILE